MKEKNLKSKNPKPKELEKIDIPRKKKSNKPNRKKEFEF